MTFPSELTYIVYRWTGKKWTFKTPHRFEVVFANNISEKSAINCVARYVRIGTVCKIACTQSIGMPPLEIEPNLDAITKVESFVERCKSKVS